MDPLRGVIHLGLKLTETTLDRALEVVKLADTLIVASAVPPVREPTSDEPVWPEEEQADLDALSATLRARRGPRESGAHSDGSVKKATPAKRTTAKKAASARRTAAKKTTPAKKTSTAAKSTAKKTAPAAKKATTKKATTKKAAPAKKATTKKAAPAKKAATKKATPASTPVTGDDTPTLIVLPDA